LAAHESLSQTLAEHVSAEHSLAEQAVAEHVCLVEHAVTADDSPSDESAEHAAAVQVSPSQLAAHSPFEH
jgi:hypothetical protein